MAKLMKLMIKNFRSISNLTIDADGHDVIISGPNGAGKSTVEMAYNWCLFGSGGNDSHIPHDTDGNPKLKQGLEPTVEVTFDIDGARRTFKRAYLEKWVTKGSRKGEFDGMEVHYYIDDLEVKARDFNAAVAEIAVDEEHAKLCSDPLYFFSLAEKPKGDEKQRQIIAPLAGDISVEPPAELVEMAAGKPLDKYYDYAKQQLKALDKALTAKQAEISVQRSNIPAVDGNPEKLEKEISNLKVQQSELEYQLRNLDNDSVKAEKRKQIAAVENKIAEARMKYQQQLDAENQKIRDGIARLEAKRRDLQAADDMAASKITRLEGEIETLADRKQAKLDRYHELLAQYKELQAKQYDGSDTCPYCGQQLSPEQIESAKAKFNADKSNQLESLKSSIDIIVAEGKKLKAEIEAKQQEVIDLKSKQESATAEINELDGRLEKGRSMLIEGKFEDTDEYKALSGKLNQLKSELESGNGNELSEKSTELQAQINDIQHKIDDADNKLRFLRQKAELQEKVNTLMSEEKQIRAEMDNYEKAIALYEEYATAKAKALESAINSKFTSVRFKLFEDVKTTGDERKICKVLLGNGSTEPSTGEKIAAGTEIVTALSKLYGISMPLWIDNAEGLTLPLHTDAQQIRMYVRDDIENLKIEVSEDD